MNHQPSGRIAVWVALALGVTGCGSGSDKTTTPQPVASTADSGGAAPLIIGDDDLLAKLGIATEPTITTTAFPERAMFEVYLGTAESGETPVVLVNVNLDTPFEQPDGPDGTVPNGRQYAIGTSAGDFDVPFDKMTSVVIASPDGDLPGIGLTTITLDTDDLLELGETITVDPDRRTVTGTGRFEVLATRDYRGAPDGYRAEYEDTRGRALDISVGPSPPNSVAMSFWLGEQQAIDGTTIDAKRAPGLADLTQFCTERDGGSVCISSSLKQLSFDDAAAIFASLRPLRAGEDNLVVDAGTSEANGDP